MTVAELMDCLKDCPPDFKVYWWKGDKRVELVEVRNVGDVVDLYEEEEDEEVDA